MMVRKLTPPEKSLWSRVVRGVSRLRADEGAGDLEEPPLPPPPQKQKPKAPKALAKTPAPKPSAKPAQDVDAATLRRLTRGQMPIEAEIDLHSMTLPQAYDALRRFLATSYASGLRCVLVIHGHGVMSGQAKIKQSLPAWLNEWPEMVLTQAMAVHHGGRGASYILLRRRRA